MLACKLAATGFSGVELSELNLSLNEVAETPLDSFALPSGIFALCSLCGSYGRSSVVDLVFARSTADGEVEDQLYRVRGDRLVISQSRATGYVRANVTPRCQLLYSHRRSIPCNLLGMEDRIVSATRLFRFPNETDGETMGTSVLVPVAVALAGVSSGI